MSYIYRWRDQWNVSVHMFTCHVHYKGIREIWVPAFVVFSDHLRKQSCVSAVCSMWIFTAGSDLKLPAVLMFIVMKGHVTPVCVWASRSVGYNQDLQELKVALGLFSGCVDSQERLLLQLWSWAVISALKQVTDRCTNQNKQTRKKHKNAAFHFTNCSSLLKIQGNTLHIQTSHLTLYDEWIHYFLTKVV